MFLLLLTGGLQIILSCKDTTAVTTFYTRHTVHQYVLLNVTPSCSHSTNMKDKGEGS